LNEGKHVAFLPHFLWKMSRNHNSFSFIVRVVRHWNRLPGEIVAAPSLGVFKARLDGDLSSLV